MAEDLTGQKFNLLTVLSLDHIKGYDRYWKCRCDCGKTTTVAGSKLKSGKTKSCGCYRKAKSSETAIKNFTKHGDRQRDNSTRLYSIWQGMHARCKTKPRYKNRGICVCPEWNEYTVFKDWALSNGYNDNLTIDRIDNDGNYEPNNCRWADQKIQANNRSNNRVVEYSGERHTAADWAETFGIPNWRIIHRLNSGFPLEEVFSKNQLTAKARNYDWQYLEELDAKYSRREIERVTGVSRGTLLKYLGPKIKQAPRVRIPEQ